MKRVWILVALILATVALTGLTPLGLNQVNEWLALSDSGIAPHFVVMYNSTNAKYHEDAVQMLGFVHDMLYNSTTGNLVNAQYPYDTTFASYNLPGPDPSKFPQYNGYVAIFLYDRQTWYDMGHSESTWYESSGTINCLSFSDVSDSDTWVKDPSYYQKNFVHEFVHVITWGDLAKSNPNYYNDIPFWLSEGMAEYISVFCTTSDILHKYNDTDGYGVRVSTAITEIPLLFNFPGDYTLAAYVGEYMYENYSKINTWMMPPAVLMWKNPLNISKFWDAVNEYFGVKTKFQFEQKWYEWASNKFGVGNRYPFLEADIDKDGRVGLSDLVILARYWGQTLASMNITGPTMNMTGLTETFGNGQIEWTNDVAHRGNYSAKLMIPQGASHNSWAIVKVPYVGSLDTLESFSFYVKYHAACPCFIVYLDKNGDGVADCWLLSDYLDLGNNEWTLATGGLKYGWTEATYPDVGTYGKVWESFAYWKQLYPHAKVLYVATTLEYWAVGSGGFGEPLYVDEAIVNGITYDLEPVHP